AELGLARLQKAIDDGRIDAAQPITEQGLADAGVIRRVLDGVRLLGKEGLKAAITIEVSGASRGAVAAVEAAGGAITVRKPARAVESTAAADSESQAD
ncbi:MAG: uL15m family ribosomal protein, partial [Alphaproteobacteria bacterium]